MPWRSKIFTVSSEANYQMGPTQAASGAVRNETHHEGWRIARELAAKQRSRLDGRTQRNDPDSCDSICFHMGTAGPALSEKPDLEEKPEEEFNNIFRGRLGFAGSR